MSIIPSNSTFSEMTTTPVSAEHSKKTNVVDDPPPKKKKRKRRSTSHLKDVPATLKQREEIKVAAEKYAAQLDKSNPFTKDQLEKHGHQLLKQMTLSENFLGFAMVQIGNFFWKQQFISIPYERRMLLLPHCLKHAEGCPADYDAFGLDCETCGACSIADYKVKAEKLGYKVLVAEGSPVVLKIIVSGHIDGILGVACLNVLEKAIDKVIVAGVPSYAIPLHSGDCKNTKLDESWVWDVLEVYQPDNENETSSYIPLMRAANSLFKDDFEKMLPRIRSKTTAQANSPLGFTENAAYSWLANGGKRFRPFMTLAAHDALSGGHSLQAGINGDSSETNISVGRVAMAIEAFHKASLVHDDIQDDDMYRYGKETLHRQHNTGTAINIGDHLIGLGYRLVNFARDEIGTEAACDILDCMSQAHIKLCDGQGAEMAFQNAPDWSLTPLDALQIYALKTSPAFEAALYAGVRLAGESENYEEMLSPFCRHLGVAFQILNDLKDWRGDDNNKLITGQDALALRPTILLALTLQSATEEEKAEIHSLLLSQEEETSSAWKVGKLRQLFQKHRAFTKAETLIEKSRAKAEALADNVESESFRQLLYFLIDTVLAEDEPVHVDPSVISPLPILPG